MISVADCDPENPSSRSNSKDGSMCMAKNDPASFELGGTFALLSGTQAEIYNSTFFPLTCDMSSCIIFSI